MHVAHFDFQGEHFALVSHPSAAQATLGALTPAEHAVATLVMDGHSNAQVARLRRTSVHTVGNQIASIFRKLGVSSRFELIARRRMLHAPGRRADAR